MATPSHADLTRTQGIHPINGHAVVDVAETTLRAGASLVETWRELEPIVKQLIGQVRTYIKDEELAPPAAAKLLGLCASVAQRVGAAATGVLRASEGQAKLALLLDAGRVRRPQPEALTEKQLIARVLEVAKRIHADGQPCPICHTPPALEVTPCSSPATSS